MVIVYDAMLVGVGGIVVAGAVVVSGIVVAGVVVSGATVVDVAVVVGATVVTDTRSTGPIVSAPTGASPRGCAKTATSEPAARAKTSASPNPNDANAGSFAAPFATVTKAITVAASGQAIYLKQGNYGSDRPRITKPLRLFNWGDTGLARIGQP